MEKHQQVHRQHPESGKGNLVLRFMREKLERMSGIVQPVQGAYIAFQKSLDLILHALRLSQQALVHTKALESSLASAYVVYLCPFKRERTLRKIF